MSSGTQTHSLIPILESHRGGPRSYKHGTSPPPPLPPSTPTLTNPPTGAGWCPLTDWGCMDVFKVFCLCMVLACSAMWDSAFIYNDYEGKHTQTSLALFFFIFFFNLINAEKQRTSVLKITMHSSEGGQPLYLKCRPNTPILILKSAAWRHYGDDAVISIKAKQCPVIFNEAKGKKCSTFHYVHHSIYRR